MADFGAEFGRYAAQVRRWLQAAEVLIR